MEQRSGLKERLSRMFRPSTLLRSSCNSTSATSIFSSSTAVTSKRTTTTTATADVALDPFFNIPRRHSRRPTVNDYLINSFLGDSVDRSLPFLSADDAGRPRRRALPPLPPRLSVDWGAACRPNGPECGERPAIVTRKKMKKKERRVRESGGLYETGAREGRVCPPASPSTPFIGFHDGKKNINTTKKKKKKKLLLSNGYGFSSSSSAETEDDQLGLFSSDKEGADREEETETFFSSKSFSSDSSEFYQRPSSKNRRRKPRKKGKRESKAPAPDSSGFRPLVSVSKEEEEEKDGGGGGFPVMKRSRDPYADFRSSMVEMIIERQIFGSAELERLLRAYLSLNCPRHHPVILRAFADIWEVLSGH